LKASEHRDTFLHFGHQANHLPSYKRDLDFPVDQRLALAPSVQYWWFNYVLERIAALERNLLKFAEIPHSDLF
jgi:hypothetical protein